MLRSDVMYFKEGLLGSHEFQTGFLAMPRSIYRKNVHFLNDGFILEQRRMVDPANAAAGTIPFARQYILGDLNLDQSKGRDKDIGFYGQDSWKAGRLTTTLGLRVDLVRRFDVLRNLQRQSSTEIAPRLGFSYVLTEDAKNVLRGTYGKYHQQLMGTRNPVPSFGGNDQITGGAGADVVVGGDGGDTIKADDGDNVVAGGSARMTFAVGLLSFFATAGAGLGDDDEITTGRGDDVDPGSLEGRVVDESGGGFPVGNHPGLIAGVQIEPRSRLHPHDDERVPRDVHGAS